jgi:hypothetical protein
MTQHLRKNLLVGIMIKSEMLFRKIDTENDESTNIHHPPPPARAPRSLQFSLFKEMLAKAYQKIAFFFQKWFSNTNFTNLHRI